MSSLTYEQQVKLVWKITIYLSILTIAEVAAAIIYPEGMPRLPLNIAFILMGLWKAFYIVGTFMHLKFEIKNLQLTVLVPLFILIWFIIAFLWEGNTWLHYRAGDFF